MNFNSHRWSLAKGHMGNVGLIIRKPEAYATVVTPVINPFVIVMPADWPLVMPSFATGYVPSAGLTGCRAVLARGRYCLVRLWWSTLAGRGAWSWSERFR